MITNYTYLYDFNEYSRKISILATGFMKLQTKKLIKKTLFLVLIKIAI